MLQRSGDQQTQTTKHRSFHLYDVVVLKIERAETRDFEKMVRFGQHRDFVEPQIKLIEWNTKAQCRNGGQTVLSKVKTSEIWIVHSIWHYRDLV